MSVKAYVAGFQLDRALREEGFPLPRECRHVELQMPVDGTVYLRYEVNLTGEDLVKLGRALTRLGTEDSR